jgi:hypothetical protein
MFGTLPDYLVFGSSQCSVPSIALWSSILVDRQGVLPDCLSPLIARPSLNVTNLM